MAFKTKYDHYEYQLMSFLCDQYSYKIHGLYKYVFSSIFKSFCNSFYKQHFYLLLRLMRMRSIKSLNYYSNFETQIIEC